MIHNIGWLTEKQDMTTVSSILKKHFMSSDLSIIPFFTKKKFSLTPSLSDPLKEELPEWLEEIKITFLDHYGYEHGLAILFNVMTKYILKTKQIH